MSDQVHLKEVVPTVFLRKGDTGLEQLLRVSVEASAAVPGASLTAAVDGKACELALGELPEGESCHEVFLLETSQPREVAFTLKEGGNTHDTRTLMVRPPKRWKVHVIQVSHHDVGYTNLASVVHREHDQFLDRVIDMAAATRTFPDESQFRIVVEQAWSIDHYLKHAPQARAAEMVKLMQSGHVEVTALFGNMTTELCGHEPLARTVYHAFRLKREHGIPIVSAQHNDVPGVSWGVATVLTEAGIKIFFPRFPYYYGWGGQDLRGFWDEDAIFAHDGPAAFWWEAPSGKRVLLYSPRARGWGGNRADLPGLADYLRALEDQDYPYSVMRCLVSGGARDNAPYIEGYAHTIREWNGKWAYPRLVCSTDGRFYEDFVEELPQDLPVIRGELPCQDYPSGATSTAAATAANRNNHSALMASERLAAFAAGSTDFIYPKAELDEAAEEILWHDEHTWGHHFPCGPTSRAAEQEKSLHAYRSATFLHDVTNKALARIADHVRIEDENFHLVVFNPSPYVRSDIVQKPLREIENCGSTMHEVPAEGPGGSSYLRGVALTDRWHEHPPQELTEGKFDLVDMSSGECVPYQFVDIDGADATVPYAAQRFGLGAGGKRYGFFELPSGLRRDLVFLAEGVPACGYKTYKLSPRESPASFASAFRVTDESIENEFYEVTFDAQRGRICGIWDKASGCELLDAGAPYGLGDLLVRTPEATEPVILEDVEISIGESGPVCVSVRRSGRVLGHPSVVETLRLFAGVRRVELEIRVLKDATPLLDAHLAFPFACEPPQFRYEGNWSVMTPITDFMPGAYSDALTVQNWLKVSSPEQTLLWSSLDAPIVSLGDLWPGYVSPAHSCVIADRVRHDPLKLEDLRKGWVFSTLFCNNFGTNFYCTQSGDFLFRYSFSSQAGQVPDSDAARHGWEANLPFEHIFTRHDRERPLPVSAGFLEVEGPGVQLVACKQAEDGNGHMLRLWNTSPDRVEAKVRLSASEIAAARLCNLAEEDTGVALEHDGGEIAVPMPPYGCVTMRVVGKLFALAT